LHKRESEQNLQEVIARYDMKAQTIADSLDKMFDLLQKFDASKYSKEALTAKAGIPPLRQKSSFFD